MEIDPELLVPDPTLSVSEGAIAPWSRAAAFSNYYDQVAEALAESYGVNLDAPWEDLPQEHRDLFLQGTKEPLAITYRNRFGRRRSYSTRFAGLIANLEKRYRETESEGVKEKLEEYMSLRACPVCGGARLRAESRAVLVGGTRIEDFCALSARRAIEWLERGGALRDRPPRGAADPARDRRAAAVPGERGDRLPLDGPRLRDALRRGGPADPAGHADRLLAGGGAVHPRRALDRPAPARQLEADRHPGAPARPRQHGDRGRARRADDARRRPPRGPRPRRGRARGADRRAGHRRAGAAREGVRHRPVPRGHPRGGGARQAPHTHGLCEGGGRHAAQPPRRRRRLPARRAHLRDGGLGLGQVHARQRDPLQGGVRAPAPRARPRPAPTARSAASISSTRSSPSTSPRSGAPRARTPPPTPACST